MGLVEDDILFLEGRAFKLQLVGGWTNPSEKYARQIGSFPQVGVKIKHIWVATTQFCMVYPPGN